MAGIEAYPVEESDIVDAEVADNLGSKNLADRISDEQMESPGPDPYPEVSPLVEPKADTTFKDRKGKRALKDRISGPVEEKET